MYKYRDMNYCAVFSRRHLQSILSISLQLAGVLLEPFARARLNWSQVSRLCGLELDSVDHRRKLYALLQS
jgi:hypothetical protein